MLALLPKLVLVLLLGLLLMLRLLQEVIPHFPLLVLQVPCIIHHHPLQVMRKGRWIRLAIPVRATRMRTPLIFPEYVGPHRKEGVGRTKEGSDTHPTQTQRHPRGPTPLTTYVCFTQLF